MKQRLKKKLSCHGCSHEAADPCRKGLHIPGGERPCCFCLRNDKRKYEVKEWYDGSKPVKIPMDCYLPLDMLMQMIYWEKERPGPLERIFNPSKREET